MESNERRYEFIGKHLDFGGKDGLFDLHIAEDQQFVGVVITDNGPTAVWLKISPSENEEQVENERNAAFELAVAAEQEMEDEIEEAVAEATPEIVL